MVALQELQVSEIDQVLQSALERQIPVTVTLLENGHWVNQYTRLVEIGPQRVLIEMPVAAAAGQQHEFSPADKIGLSFKLKHHKYIVSGTVAGRQRHCGLDGVERGVLSVCKPSRMHRLQRRLYIRAVVPDGIIARASLWLGGREAEPAGVTPQTPVWSGRIMNLSLGGIQVTVSDSGVRLLETGDLLGVRMAFGAGQETVFGDLQLRHIAADGDNTILGLQLLGLEQTSDGRKAIAVLGRRITEFQRLAPDDRPGREE